MGHASHSACELRLARLPRLPAPHGMGWTLPSTQWWPSGHASHAVWPGVRWKLPPEQGVHATLPGAAAKLPALHGWHASALAAPSDGLAVPASHAAASALVLPAAHQKPAAQGPEH